MYRSLVNSSDSIRKSIFTNSVFAVGGALGIGCYAKNTVLLKYYGKYLSIHGDNGPVEPSMKLEEMVSGVCEDLGELISENTTIRTIAIPGLRTTHAGTILTFQGGLVGLPSFFEFNKKDDVEGKIEWDQSSVIEAEEIYNSFLLSDEAKKYGIAREILLVNNVQVYVDTLLPVFVAVFINQIGLSASTQAEIAKLPQKHRLFPYILMSLFGFALWRFLHIQLQRYYERKVHKNISKFGEDYVRGAIEYNTKEMQRNMCSASLKDQKNRFMNILSDIAKLFVSGSYYPDWNLRFYNSLKKSEEIVEN